MDTKASRASVSGGSIPETAIVVGAIVFCALIYGFASGNASGRYLETDRGIVLDCWKSIESRVSPYVDRETLIQGCERLEHGFNLKYGRSR